MWFYNRIILLAIILLLPKTSVAEANSETFTGKYWSESEKDWPDATIKFDMTKEIMSVYNRDSMGLIAKFGPDTPVLVAPIQIESNVLPDIQEAIENAKSSWVFGLALVPLAAARVIEARYGKFTFIGRLVRSPHVRYLIKKLPLLGEEITKKDELQHHNYFFFFGEPYLQVRVKKEKKDEFLKKTKGLFMVATVQLPPEIIEEYEKQANDNE